MQPEGPNAGSDAATAERHHASGDVRRGGHPEEAPPQTQRPDPSDDELAGAPGTDRTDAGQDEATAAQDAGRGE